MLPTRTISGIVVVGLATLCQCSLLFDLSGLNASDGGLVEGGLADGVAGDDGAVGSVRTDGGGADDNGDMDRSPGVDGSVPADAGGEAEGASGQDGSSVPEGSSNSDGAGGSDGASDADGASSGDGGPDSGNVTAGLIAYYPFDETSGTTAADASGNGHTANLMGGASWAAGHRGGAVSLDGSTGYVRLANGLLSTATDFTVAAWVKLNSAPTWARIFDFGTGMTAYMFLTCNAGSGMRFAITTTSYSGEQRIDGPTFATGAWQHVAVTLKGAMATLYVNGAMLATNANVTLTPTSLGTTTQTWIGRSEYSADPYANGLWDEFRMYNRALSSAEVQTLAK